MAAEAEQGILHLDENGTLSLNIPRISASARNDVRARWDASKVLNAVLAALGDDQFEELKKKLPADSPARRYGRDALSAMNSYDGLCRCVDRTVETLVLFAAACEVLKHGRAALTMAGWKEVLEKAKQDWYDKPAGEVVEAFLKEFPGFKLDIAERQAFESLVRVRNIFVHRSGLVSRADLRGARRLHVQLCSISLSFRNDSGRRQTRMHLAIGEQKKLRTQLKPKRYTVQFKEGEQIALTDQEMADAAQTLLEFLRAMERGVATFARTQSMNIAGPAAGGGPAAEAQDSQSGT